MKRNIDYLAAARLCVLGLLLALFTSCGKPSSSESKGGAKGAADVSAEIKKLDTTNVDGLIEGLTHKDRRVRAAAAQKLGERKVDELKAIEALIPVLADHWGRARKAASDALGSIGEPSVEPLIATMRSDHPHSRMTFAVGEETRSIRQMVKNALGDVGAAAVPKLIAALDSDDLTLRLNASGALGRIGEVAKAAVPRLVKAASDPEPGVRRNAIGDLVRIDPTNPAVAATVKKALEDADQGVKEEAHKSMEIIEEAGGGGPGEGEGSVTDPTPAAAPPAGEKAKTPAAQTAEAKAAPQGAKK
jgi:HEAT repeat protein